MSSLNSDLTVSNGDRWYESGEPSEQTAEGETQEGEKKERSGREWRFKGARIKRSLPARGDVLTGRKPPPRGGKRGRERGGEGQKQAGKSEGGGDSVSQPMWQNVRVSFQTHKESSF